MHNAHIVVEHTTMNPGLAHAARSRMVRAGGEIAVGIVTLAINDFAKCLCVS